MAIADALNLLAKFVGGKSSQSLGMTSIKESALLQADPTTWFRTVFLPALAAHAVVRSLWLDLGGEPAELRLRGYGVKIFEKRELPGGLNTHGVAEYKLRAADSG